MLATNRTAFALLVAGLVLPRLVDQPLSARPQEPPAKSFTLDEAMRYALANYPAVRASLERVSGAKAGVDLARTNYLPRLALAVEMCSSAMLCDCRRNECDALACVPPVAGQRGPW